MNYYKNLSTNMLRVPNNNGGFFAVGPEEIFQTEAELTDLNFKKLDPKVAAPLFSKEEEEPEEKEIKKGIKQNGKT